MRKIILAKSDAQDIENFNKIVSALGTIFFKVLKSSQAIGRSNNIYGMAFKEGRKVWGIGLDKNTGIVRMLTEKDTSIITSSKPQLAKILGKGLSSKEALSEIKIYVKALKQAEKDKKAEKEAAMDTYKTGMYFGNKGSQEKGVNYYLIKVVNDQVVWAMDKLGKTLTGKKPIKAEVFMQKQRVVNPTLIKPQAAGLWLADL